jgi:pyrroloquinoline quinone (PQQ) biosynthesis protein C
MALTTEYVLEAIKGIHKERSNYGHPLWKGMVDGSHNLEQVRYFCKQHSIITLHNHNYHGRLYVSCPDPEWRERIAEVAYEEATGRLFAHGVSHHKLYLNYAAGLGMGRDVMYNVDYCAGALAFKAYFTDVCSRFMEGVAGHMLAGEAQIPGLYGRIADNLKKKFGLDDVALAYWYVHDKADEDHSDAGRELVEKFARTEADRELVIKTVRKTVDVMFVMYDDVWSHMRTLQ